MKKYICLIGFVVAILSCSKDKSPFDSMRFPQKWKLVQISSEMGIVSSGEDMEWQETYELQADGTFTKTREKNAEIVSASGTFSYEEFSDDPYLVLMYNSESPIIGNCSAEAKEELAVKEDLSLVSTWQACDGPGLVYERVD